jgi:hypothetical protein
MQFTVPSPVRASAIGDALASKRAKVTLLLVVVVLTAGCSGAGGDDPATGADPLDSVPADVDVVVQIDGQASNETAAAIASELNGSDIVPGEAAGDGSDAWTRMLAANGSGLGPEDVDSVTAFARLPDMANASEMDSDESAGAIDSVPYAGAIVETDVSWEEVVEATDGKLDETDQQTVDGVTVHVLDVHETETWIAEFGDGTFGVGTEAAVRDVIETRTGEAAPLSGELRSAFENADDGLMKVAVDLPDETFQSVGEGEQSEIPAELDLPEVRVLTFVTDTEGTNVSMAAQLTTADEEGASELAGLFQFASGFGEQMSEEDGPSLLKDLTVEQDGRHVTVRTTLTAAEIADLLEQFQQLDFGMEPAGTSADSTATDAQPSLGEA